MADSGRNAPTRIGRSWCPIPHFYEETWSYLNGNIRILDKLPAVKMRALRKARGLKTPALARKDFNAASQGQAETLRWMANPSREALGQVLGARDIATQSSRAPRLPPDNSTLTFTPSWGMVDRATLLTSITLNTLNQQSLLREGTDERPMSGCLRDPDISKIKTGNAVHAYDGLRSCPPLVADSARTWRPYLGRESRTEICHPRAHHRHAVNTPAPYLMPTGPSPPDLNL
ncbi:hypothetical protein MMYC01_202353, partial [Madurella mycetomatis]